MVLADTGLRIIDADTHLTEPTDLWTARLPERFRDEAPQVRFHEPTGTWRWQIGDRWCTMVGNYSVAGWRELYPSCPPTLEEADPACYDAKARLALMDSEGIYAQVLYPNVIAFEGHTFIALKDDALKLACVQTYNDYQSEFASEAPDRFILLSMLPFWDLDASLVELQRCYALGHKGILWASTLEKHGLPEFMDPHWDRLYAMAQTWACRSTSMSAWATRPRRSSWPPTAQATTRRSTQPARRSGTSVTADYWIPTDERAL